MLGDGSAFSVRTALTETAAALAEIAVDNARREARVLVGIALKAEPLEIVTSPERELSSEERSALEIILKRRLAGEPSSRIRGYREFWSLDFAIGPSVLDPRPETELLVERALDHAGKLGQRPLRILDLGTGSGCILLSLLHELPEAVGFGVDQSGDALVTAKTNAHRLGLGDRCSWLCGAWMQPIAGRFDLIVSNPPYIPTSDVATLDRGVRNYDPILALDGGEDGLTAYREIIPQIPRFLRDSGGAFLEVGAGQARAVAQMGEESGLTAEIAPDLARIPRAVGLFTEF